MLSYSADIGLWLIAIVLMGAGIAGTVLPALPGPPLMFAGMLLAAWIDGFRSVGLVALAVLGAITLLASLVDLAAGVYGAKRVGASRRAIAGAALGTLCGMFLGIPGLVFGPFLGALIGEYLARRNAVAAGRVAIGTWLGLVVAIAIKLALVCAMIGLFVLAFVF
jgi:hypothetical protein